MEVLSQIFVNFRSICVRKVCYITYLALFLHWFFMVIVFKVLKIQVSRDSCFFK